MHYKLCAILWLWCALLSWSQPVPDDYTLDYTVTLDTAGHYLLVDLSYSATAASPRPDVVFNMPRWAPGYYEMLDFAKHLTDFSAFDTRRQPVAWAKEGLNRWRVTLPADRRVNISYRIYANHRDVAISRVDSAIAFIAPNGVFMHVDGEQHHPVNLRFVMPGGWRHIATGLRPHEGDSTAFTAPDFDVLYDSPFLLGYFHRRRFTHEQHDYELALETPDGVDSIGFEADFRSIVSATTRIMGDVPYDNYCLIHMGEGQVGLEHFNSQACYISGSYHFASRRDHVKFLALTAHEYFHLYNVKCIRPAELWPYDYDHEAVTPMLWVSEGLTCYYESRILRDAGIATPVEALEHLSNYLSLYAPYDGQRHQSLRQCSYDIWLNSANDDANGRDVRINFYFKGPIVGLLLDIDIRRKTQLRQSLDDVMRLLYRRYYRQLRRGFTEDEFWQACAEVAGQQLTGIRRIVETTEDVDYAAYLDEAGLYVDSTDWSIRRVASPSPRQQQFLRSMNLAD